MKIDVETRVPSSMCCECGYGMDACSGPSKPSPGDFTLCINCASLNVFADDLTLRHPLDEEFFAAAADSDIQQMRRVILSLPRMS